jgi:hypothetical protein
MEQIHKVLACIDEIIESLPTKQQIIIAIRYEDAAGALEKPVSAARERLQKLRDELQRPAAEAPADRSARRKPPAAQA